MSPSSSIHSDGKMQHKDVPESEKELEMRKPDYHADDDDGENTRKRRLSASSLDREKWSEPVPPRPKKLLKSVEKESGLLGLVTDFDGLSPMSVGTRVRLEEPPEQADARLNRMHEAVRTILECIGENPDRPGLLDTPKRYAKAMLFFTNGYQQQVQDIVNNAIYLEEHNEMVVVKDIEIFSMCEHHMVPFTGKMHIGYVPNNAVIGLSKLPRIAEMFSRRLQIQERLTKEVANAIMEVLKPKGVAVLMESSHLCMVTRGVEKSTATTTTTCVLGCFKRKLKTRNEFLSLVGIKKQ